MGVKLYLIAAACENMGIGYKNDLPWTLKKEMMYFTRMTTTVSDPGSGKMNAVLMGRNTWESIPDKYRPLKNRLNIVLTSREFKPPPGVFSYQKFDEAIKDLSTSDQFKNIEKVWIVGGSSVYKIAMDSSNCHRIYLTRVQKLFECDVFFPQVDTKKFIMVKDPEVPDDEQEEDGIKYRFEVYEAKS